MSTYSVPDLLQKWKLGEVTVEQAFGYLLQNMLALVQRQAEMENRLRQLEQAVNQKP